MPVNFAHLLETLYRELDSARASFADVPSGALRALIGRYDRARQQAQPPVVDASDPASVSGMCDTLKPLYEAVVGWDRGLVTWMRSGHEDYDGPMLHLAFNPFHAFFRGIAEQRYPDEEGRVQQIMDGVLILGNDPWEFIRGS